MISNDDNIEKSPSRISMITSATSKIVNLLFIFFSRNGILFKTDSLLGTAPIGAGFDWTF